MWLQHVCVFLIVLTFSTRQLRAQEVISTWPFAQKIGWRGIQITSSFFTTYDAAYQGHQMLVRSAPEEMKPQIKKDLAYTTYGYWYNDYVTLGASGVFLPFRSKNKRWLKTTEWVTGIQYMYGQQWIGVNSPEWYGVYSVKNSSLLWTNQLLVESRTFLNRCKLYAGPGVNLSLMPGYRITRNDSLLNSAFFQTGLTAVTGLKISLGCRINLNFEYQYNANFWFLKEHVQTGQHWGLSLGLRYKFVKPDPIPREDTNPVFW